MIIIKNRIMESLKVSKAQTTLSSRKLKGDNHRS